jgi:mRNA interferase YafQ
MLTPDLSANFKRDIKRLRKRNKDMDKLKNVIDILLNESPLPSQYRDHPLKGDLDGFRDCHVEFDWLLVYAIGDGKLWLSRTGTHMDIYE